MYLLKYLHRANKQTRANTMNEKTQNAIAAMKAQLAIEIDFLVDQEGYVDDVNNEVDEDDDGEDGFVSEADTVIFFGELIERLEGGWVPESPEECNNAAMGFYQATQQDSGMGYGDTDSTDSICEDLMEAFGITYDEEFDDA
jgi:hypothetical protein